MDTLDTYHQIIQNVLSEYVHIRYAYGEIQNEAIFDRENGHYLIMSVGWEDVKRIHGCLIHIDLIDDKVWVQRDGTESGITHELVQAGIPKNRIVLGFHEPGVRQYREYAIA